MAERGVFKKTIVIVEAPSEDRDLRGVPVHRLPERMYEVEVKDGSGFDWPRAVMAAVTAAATVIVLDADWPRLLMAAIVFVACQVVWFAAIDA